MSTQHQKVPECCVRWCTPHWLHEADYRDVVFLSDTHKRWELLRRMPSYRSAWTRHGASVGAFKLMKMIDPACAASRLKDEPKFFDEEFAGGALAVLLPVPPISDFLESPGSVVNVRADAIALHYGRQIIHLLESGYVLFSADPQLSASSQALKMKKHLSQLQTNSLQDSDEKTPRINKKKEFSIVTLLRVLDAYEQEGLIGSTSKRGMKTAIGKKIFSNKRFQEDDYWHKLAESAFQQAKKIAFGT